MKKLIIDLDLDPAWIHNPYAWEIFDTSLENEETLACGHAETAELAFSDGMSKLALLRMKEII